MSSTRVGLLHCGFGAAFGSLLALLGFGALGAGHGTFYPLLISSAPISSWGLTSALLGAPLLWATIGTSVAMGNKTGWRWIPACLLLAHTVLAVILVVKSNPDEYIHLQRALSVSPEFSAIWSAVYAFGQLYAWRQILRKA